MSTGVSPTLSSLVLEGDDGASPWGDERSQSTPPVAIPEDSGFQDSTPKAGTAPKSKPKPKPVGAAARRTPRRHVVQAEAIDDTMGPLGPLGDSNSEPPTPPLSVENPPQPPMKEAGARAGVSRVGTGSTAGSSSGNLMHSVTLDEDEDGLHRAQPEGVALGEPSSSSQPSQPPAPTKPTFEISVGDPHKVGDLTTAHTVYQVRTKTNSKAFRVPEFTVTRRYRDFLWLYDVLNDNNPGVVVAPPPEKQAVGRFDENFVETRRAALERMLNRICQHPILLQDNDLKLFLESESLSVDIKHRIHNPPLPTESKGMFGFGGFSSGTKFVETDDFFHDRRQYLDALETQLKSLLKAVDGVVKHRKDLAEAASDFSSSLHALSTVELSKSLSQPLDHLSALQIRIKELHERQAAQDILTIGITVDEYIRIISSIKLAFSQRQKAYQNYHNAENELVKKRLSYEKLQRQGKTQTERLTQLSAEVADSERKVQRARVLFDDMGRLLRTELERFEKEKVEDFKSSVETFLESAVEAQKELIELWESYLLQLDREDAEASDVPPPITVAQAAAKKIAQQEQQAQGDADVEREEEEEEEKDAAATNEE